MVTNRINFFATRIPPKPEEVDYWVDLTSNRYGGCIRYHDGDDWVILNPTGSTDLSNFYTKNEVNRLLGDKADDSTVNTKVNETEIQKLVQNIDISTPDEATIQFTIYKHDNTYTNIVLPVASEIKSGIITATAFLNFVKQNELTQLNTELIAALTLKADVNTVYTKSDVYTKSEVDAKVQDISTIKADKSNTYTKAETDQKVADLVSSAPETLNTLNELAEALGNDPNFATTVSNQIGTKLSTATYEEDKATFATKSEVDNKVDKVNNKLLSTEDYTTSEKSKLLGIEAGAEVNDVTSVAGKTGAVTLTKSDVGLSNVDNTADASKPISTATLAALHNKVDKVTGKGLSTNDYNNTEKAKVQSMYEGDMDWYGVSWSENSSNPDCTRIGNMGMHRTLPILSAMKLFCINNNSSQLYFNEIILPIDSSGNLIFSNVDNLSPSQSVISGYSDTNVFVKVPEFWYCDDYVPSTKTHNLKISPYNKPGWQHHKEAYVASYEGYSRTDNSVTRYVSQKGVIPTVSKTRTTFRTEARANGSNKWNIYTYEEHRAICHLFLVEYATRHCQKAVNTALTAEGFRQGGLGTGCTTGTVTLNGATAYAICPTGLSDSLGSGSGEVTVTVQQTDSSGNNTSTVTRKVNRYRGIENPFGHIWKHCDDIISQLNGSNRIYYFCAKPEHFATNKNEYYKPLIAGPGDTAVQGWKKEIKASINCDFFAMAVGGNETAYWCDYNYDNNDTSEHCLLIGGNSDYGGKAGLFYLHSYYGVTLSSVTIGSRLTYLPWAE